MQNNTTNLALGSDETQFVASNKGLFANNAPVLWQAGLPVIPLRPRGKEPLMPNWSQYKEKMPTAQEQDHWLRNYADCNIGLPLGPQSGLVAIDIDTEDPELIRIIDQICGYSPWERIGQKGKVMLFKYSGQKACKIKDIEGHMICELLSAGNQVVLPPSIHPKTQQPYHANCHIVDALPQVRELHPDIETLLRNAFQMHGVTLSHSGWTRTTDYVSQGSRDVKMTAMSGFFASAVTRGEFPLLEAIDRMRAWKSACVENVAGDDIDIEKGIRNLIQFLIQDVIGPKNKPLPLGWDTGLTPEQKQEWGLNFDSSHQEWSIDQIKGYLKTEFEKFEEGSIQRMTSIEFILQRISRSPSLSSLEIDTILKYITQTNRKDINLAALRKRLTELQAGEIQGNDHTEIARAVLADLQRIGEIRFWNDNFWQYKGSNWDILDQQEILSTIANNYGHLPAAKRAADHAGIMKVLQSIVPQGDLNTKKIQGVNFANCFVTSEGLTMPHNPAYGCTYTLPFRYMPELQNQHPMFDKFLQSVWGHNSDFADRVQALREAMCITFFGLGPSFARAILLYGIAGSGKSQLLEVVKRMLPPQVVSYVTPYKFDDKFEVTELSKSLLNVCGELQETQPIPGAAFKSIIDGSILNGQYKGRQIFSFQPMATHWFASNYLPKTKDVSEGFNRRWLVLRFDKPVDKSQKVRDIGNLIAAEEREAIAAWVIAAIKDVTSKGDILLPASHFDIMKDIASENDTVFFFLTSEEGPKISSPQQPSNENLPSTSVSNTDLTKSSTSSETISSQKVMSPTTGSGSVPLPSLGNKKKASIQVNSLYEKYTSFCYATARARPVGLRRFLQRLDELGTFMGFRVEGLMVNGLTMDKG